LSQSGAFTDDFVQLYRTNSTEWCHVTNGELLIIDCSSQLFEVHTSSLFLRNQILPFYKAFFSLANEEVRTPQTYSKMDTGSWQSMNKISYIVNKTFQILRYREVSDLGTTLVQTYTVS
jgi:hypothetical protein